MPAVFGHLAQPEGSAGDAHVKVHAHEDDVVDVARFQEVPDLDTGVTDRIFGLINAQHVDLPCPRRLGIESLG